MNDLAEFGLSTTLGSGHNLVLRALSPSDMHLQRRLTRFGFARSFVAGGSLLLLTPPAHAAPKAHRAPGKAPLVNRDASVSVGRMKLSASQVSAGEQIGISIWVQSTGAAPSSGSEKLFLRCKATTGTHSCPVEDWSIPIPKIGAGKSKKFTLRTTGWKAGNYELESWAGRPGTAGPRLTVRVAVQVDGVVRVAAKTANSPPPALGHGASKPKTKSKVKSGSNSKKGFSKKSGKPKATSKSGPNGIKKIPAPDLSVSVELPPGGAVWPMQVRVSNASVTGAPATKLEIRFEHREDGRWRPFKDPISIPIPALTANSNYVVPGLSGNRTMCPPVSTTVSVDFGDQDQLGICRVGAMVDLKNRIKEADEKNNMVILNVVSTVD